jgi:hypothetical protein
MIDQPRRQLAPFVRLVIQLAVQIVNGLLALGEQPFRRFRRAASTALPAGRRASRGRSCVK